ncbi:MAG: hypothetical protein AMS15_07265 [Planctomycetes bacterium DG_23]|nr:MAG: hypothetical protein AMS15_07265 [Planctomycetes bacterium DG_23]
MLRAVELLSEREVIRASLHLPGRKRKCPGVLLCHGFTGNRIEAHFLFVKMARALEAKGMAALRFDFRGSGESEGRFHDMTLSQEIADARAALKFLGRRREVDGGRLGILGLSMGGCVAGCILGLESGIKSAALWSAPAHIRELFISKLEPEELVRFMRRGYTEFGAFRIGKAFALDLANINPLAGIARSAAPILIVHGTEDETVPLSESEALYQTARSRGVRTEKYIVKGADHTFNGVRWERRVIERTASWFGETL